MVKTRKKTETYIKTLPETVRTDVETLDKEIREVFNLKPVVWEGVFWGGSRQVIIGYGNYVFKQAKGKTVDWFKVGLAVQKKYLSVYVHAVDGNQYLVEKYAKELGKVKAGKSSISFRSLKDLNLPAFHQLLEKARQLYG
jgi:maltose-binding protein MalE